MEYKLHICIAIKCNIVVGIHQETVISSIKNINGNKISMKRYHKCIGIQS